MAIRITGDTMTLETATRVVATDRFRQHTAATRCNSVTVSSDFENRDPANRTRPRRGYGCLQDPVE